MKEHKHAAEHDHELEHAAKHYDHYMHHDEDIIPSKIYRYQIEFRKNMLRQELQGRRFGTSLDLGCGIGLNSTVLDEFTSGTLILSDISDEALKQASARKYKNKILKVKSDGADFRLQRPQKIDLVHICGVLHHLPGHIEECIANFSRYTKAGSWVVVDEPSSLNPLTRLIMKLSHADPVGDERPLRLSKILKIFAKNGYHPRNIMYYSFFVPFGLLISTNHGFISFLEKIDLLLGRSPLRSIGLRWRVVLQKS